MPPKKKDEGKGKKPDVKKAVEDKSFGMKNKKGVRSTEANQADECIHER